MDAVMACGGRRVRLIIDLSDSARFYRPAELPRGIRWMRLAVRGNSVPSDERVDQAIQLLREVKAEEETPHGSPVSIIHCTHGTNRTGYLVTIALVVLHQMSVQKALATFAKMRPPGLWKEEYARALVTKFGGSVPKLPSPPAWSLSVGAASAGQLKPLKAEPLKADAWADARADARDSTRAPPVAVGSNASEQVVAATAHHATAELTRVAAEAASEAALTGADPTRPDPDPTRPDPDPTRPDPDPTRPDLTNDEDARTQSTIAERREDHSVSATGIAATLSSSRPPTSSPLRPSPAINSTPPATPFLPPSDCTGRAKHHGSEEQSHLPPLPAAAVVGGETLLGACSRSDGALRCEQDDGVPMADEDDGVHTPQSTPPADEDEALGDTEANAKTTAAAAAADADEAAVKQEAFRTQAINILDAYLNSTEERAGDRASSQSAASTSLPSKGSANVGGSGGWTWKPLTAASLPPQPPPPPLRPPPPPLRPPPPPPPPSYVNGHTSPAIGSVPSTFPAIGCPSNCCGGVTHVGGPGAAPCGNASLRPPPPPSRPPPPQMTPTGGPGAGPVFNPALQPPPPPSRQPAPLTVVGGPGAAQLCSPTLRPPPPPPPPPQSSAAATNGHERDRERDRERDHGRDHGRDRDRRGRSGASRFGVEDSPPRRGSPRQEREPDCVSRFGVEDSPPRRGSPRQERERDDERERDHDQFWRRAERPSQVERPPAPPSPPRPSLPLAPPSPSAHRRAIGSLDVRHVRHTRDADPVPNGVIFMCNQHTMRECLERNLFGAPSGSFNQQLLSSITPRLTRLFLFNVATKALLGPYRASARHGVNLEPSAWSNTGKSFPLQVRVYAEDHGQAYELRESQISRFLVYNAPTKFQFGLNAEQAEGIGDLLLRNGTPVVSLG